MKFSATLGLAFCLLISCSKKESPPKLESLRFPVVVLFSSSSIRVCREPAELTNVHSNYVTLNDVAPVLIDSEFNIYSLDHFRSTHSGLWLMANPSGATDVTFELKTQKSGRDTARELFVRQLEKQTWRQDLESRRKALAVNQTLLEMIGAVQESER